MRGADRGNVKAMRAALRRGANRRDARFLQRFFKTGPGQYGEGDLFIGVRVPAVRAVARSFAESPLAEALELLQSPVHEERLLALLLMVRRFERGDEGERRRVFDAYLAHRVRVNNWDLVDLSAPQIVGGYLDGRSRRLLDRLARGASLWDRRIAIVSTHHFIRRGVFEDTLRIARRLFGDREDLIHKATGWMLREVGKRDRSTLEAFLDAHAARMPRTTLRYAIERFPEPQRRAYLRVPGPRTSQRRMPR